MRATETAPRAGLTSPCPQIEGKTAWGRPYAAQEATPARPRGDREVRLPRGEHRATDKKRLSEPLVIDQGRNRLLRDSPGSSSSRIHDSSDGQTLIQELW